MALEKMADPFLLDIPDLRLSVSAVLMTEAGIHGFVDLPHPLRGIYRQD